MTQIGGLIFAFAGLLTLIALLPPLAERLRLPYTVLLAALGVGLGLFIGTAGALEGLIGPGVLVDFARALSSIEITSAIFLWVFLPLLLFESAIELDSRALIEDAAPVLLMAVVAVLATTLIAGASLWWVSGFSFAACLLVAAIIATTDPIAVIAVFREVGAPRRLVSLVEGESLLNDAAAIALTTTLLAVVVGFSPPAPDAVVTSFIWDFLGGAVFGAVIGRLGALLLARLDDGGPAEVTASVALAYLAFALAELYLGVSGVVAVVAAGLVFGGHARASLAAPDWRSLSAIWGQLSFWASSLIFVLASMLVPRTLGMAGVWDLLLLAVLVVAALAARALMVFGCLPLLSLMRLTTRVQRSYKVVMLWGGLRGAVTLALALAVTENPLVPAEVQHLVTVLATGFVLFTLAFQATTLRPLIRLLHLDQLSPGERFLRERALAVTHQDIVDRLSDAAQGYGLDNASAEEIEGLYRRRLARMAEPSAMGEEMVRTQLVTALLTLTRYEVQLYLDERSRRMLSRTGGADLVQEASSLLDALRTEGLDGYKREARRQTRTDRTTQLTLWLHRRLRLERPLARRLTERLEQDLARRYVLRRLQTFNAERIERLFGERIAEVAGLFLQQRLDAVERGVDSLRLQYPEYWRAFGERHVVLAALRLEYDAYERMAEEQLLSTQILGHLQGELKAKRREVERPPRLDLGLSSIELVRTMPFFRQLDDAAQAEVAAMLMPRLTLPGEVIIAKGTPGDAMFFIASGAVEVRVEPEPIRLGTGDFFGELALLTGRPRNADVVAIGFCRLLVLGQENLQKFLKDHPELSRKLRRIARTRQS